MYISNDQKLVNNISILDRFFYINSPYLSKIQLLPKLRLFIEFIIALTMLLLLLPLFLIVTVAILIESKGNALYSQVRVGLDGKEFKIYKFRTMDSNAESSTGPVLATKNDTRVTRLGNILRKTHVDELPQLINVIFAEMSFIGPRPERPCFVNKYNESISNYSKRSTVRPGITGLAQICLSYDSTADQKIDFDLMYINNKESLIFNLLIAYYTAKKMVFFRSYNGIF